MRWSSAVLFFITIAGCTPNTGGTREEYDPSTGERTNSAHVGWDTGAKRETSLDGVRPDMPTYGEK